MYSSVDDVVLAGETEEAPKSADTSQWKSLDKLQQTDACRLHKEWVSPCGAVLGAPMCLNYIEDAGFKGALSNYYRYLYRMNYREFILLTSQEICLI